MGLKKYVILFCLFISIFVSPIITEGGTINNQTKESNVAPVDVLPGYSVSNGAGRGFLVGNVMKVLNTGISGLSIANGNLPSTFEITFYIGDNDSVITTGVQYQTWIRVPFKHDLNSVTLWTDGNVGDIVIDIWVDEASATTNGVDSDVTDADSLFDVATEPTISNAATDAYVVINTFDTGEATDIPVGSWYVINVDSVTTLTNAHIILNCTKKD